jgi:hypothetical protein
MMDADMAAAVHIQQSYGQLWQQEAADAQVAARMAGTAVAPLSSRPSTPGSTGSSGLSTLGGSFSAMSLLSMGQHEVRADTCTVRSCVAASPTAASTHDSCVS